MTNTNTHKNVPDSQRSGGVIFCNNSKCDGRMMILVNAIDVPNFKDLKIDHCLLCGGTDLEISPTLNRGIPCSNCKI